MRRGNRLITVAAGAAAFSLTCGLAQAQVDYQWTNFTAGTYNWNDPANWNPAGFPNVAGDTANVSGPATGNLTINLSSDATISGLTLGATTAPHTTTIGSTGGVLIFEATPTLASLGVAGASNIINAPIQIGPPGVEVGTQLQILDTSTNDLTLAGLIQPVGHWDRHLVNDMDRAHTLTVAGDVRFWEVVGEETINRSLWIRGSGHTHITGGFDAPGSGLVFLGQTSNNDPRSLLTLAGSNPDVNVEVQLLRAVAVIADDFAVGTGQFRSNTGNNNFLSEIHSDDDNRALKAQLGMVRPITVAGEHSLTLDNGILGRNNNPLTNLLPAGKTLTVNGDVFLWNSNELRTQALTVDGHGTTIINGPIFNTSAVVEPPAVEQPNPLTKRGTGTLTLTSTESTYTGPTNVQGGTLVFGPSVSSVATWGESSEINVSWGGAAGMADGTADPNYAEFLNKISSGSVGAIALAPSDSGLNLDFTSGDLAAKSAMSVGAQGAINYTGTITPANNTYRIGGGGTLTLPNNNQLTGSNGVTIDNGGTVVIAGTNNYTGATTIVGANITSDQLRAEARSASGGSNQMFLSSVLQVNSLPNGGVAGPIGASSSAAENLVLNGGTLRYTGGAASTDRLFTIGANGGTLDASGSGPLTFANSGAVVSDGTDNRTLTLAGSNTGNNTLASVLSNPATGTLGVRKTGGGTWVLTGNNTLSGNIAVEGGILRLTTPYTVSGVSASGDGRLDLTDQSLVVQGGNLAAINGLVASGYAGGSWNGPGINSSSAAAEAGRALGIRLQGEEDADVRVAFTWAGDASLDGQVTIADLGILAANWQGTDRFWFQGDFNYDGNVTIADLGILAANWQKGVGAGAATMSFEEAMAMFDVFNGVVVPEPSALGLVGLGMLALRRRRRV